MRYGNRLFFHHRIYDLDGTDTLFVRAMTANIRHHQASCPEYAAILENRAFSPDALRSIDDLAAIPPLPTVFLKRHTLYSVASKRLLMRATTSGTSGQTSEIGLDLTSAWHGLGMLLGTFLTHRLLSPCPTRHVVLGYQPAGRNQMGAAKTAQAMTYAALPVSRIYALRDTGTSYALNLAGICQALIRYAGHKLPVRFMGFPAYFMFLLKELQSAGIRLQLPPGSKVFLAGGWKQFFSERVDKPTLYALSEECLGIGEDRIHEFFGAVEHPIAYFDCPKHHFHVPVYARILIRDTQLQPVGYGTPGLLNLMTPMLTSMPFCSVMTDDLAVLHPGGSCGCGNPAPWFDVLGRVGLSDIKTCAAGAAELLQVSQGGGVS